MLKTLELKKIVKQVKLEGAWGELEAEICFQRQPLTKYLRKSLEEINPKSRNVRIAVRDPSRKVNHLSKVV